MKPEEIQKQIRELKLTLLQLEDIHKHLSQIMKYHLDCKDFEKMKNMKETIKSFIDLKRIEYSKSMEEK